MTRGKVQPSSPAPDLTTDPQFVALMAFLAGDANREFLELAIREAATGAAAMFSSRPLVSAFSSFSDRPTLFNCTIAAVTAWLRRPDGVESIAAEKRAIAALLARLEAGTQRDVITFDNPDRLHGLLVDCSEAGVRLGAAMMFLSLKGGAR